MSHLKTSCKSERLNECLEMAAPDQLPADLEQHLAECEICQQELEKRAAEPDFWDEAANLLSTDETRDRVMGSSDTAENENRLSIPGLIDLLGPTDDPSMLGRLGEYEISGVIGVGGMGAVLKGFDRSLHRVVAIKVMAPHLAHCGTARTRFQREARAAAAITHDNVIDIYRVSDTDGIPYLVMPFARGQSLQKRIDEGGPLATIEVLRIGRQIAAGLSAAHEQGLVHRDIKPANVLLSDGIERLVITDFGVARAIDHASMTQTGLIAGTPQYMSPEQARGEQVDCRSDLFSLGAVLYTACTGRPPFRADAAYGILRRITDTDPRPIQEINPEIPAWLSSLIEKLLAKHPADRFQSANEVAEIFEKCIAHMQQPTEVALPTSLVSAAKQIKPVVQANPYTQSKRFSRTKVYALVATAALIAGLFFGFLHLTAPSDISGRWSGESWSEINLQSVKDTNHWYSGTFVDDSGNRGAIHLEWSRLQQRYKGRWQINNGLAGAITLRLGKLKSLRGALSVDSEFNLDSSQTRLRDFEWQRATSERFRDSAKEPNRKNPASSWVNKIDDSLLDQATQIYKAKNGRDPTSDELKTMFDPTFLKEKGIEAVLPKNLIQSTFFGGQPKKWTKIQSPMNGMITYVNKSVVKDSFVKKGTIVIQVQSPSGDSIDKQESRISELEKKLAATRAKSESYANNVESFTTAAEFAKQADKAQLDAGKAKLKTTESKLQLHKDSLVKAEGDLENIEKLAKNGLATPTEIETEKQRIKLAKIHMSAAQNDIAVQEKELVALQASFRERDALNQTRIDSAKALYQEELSKLATLEKEVKDAKTKLSKYTTIGIAAPTDGIVSYVRRMRVGQTVKVEDVLVMLDPSRVQGKSDPNVSISGPNINRKGNNNPNRNRNNAFSNFKNRKGSNSINTGIADPSRTNPNLIDISGTGLQPKVYADLASSFESISRIKKEIRASRSKVAEKDEEIEFAINQISNLNSQLDALKVELAELKAGKAKPKTPFDTVKYKESLIKKNENDLDNLDATLKSIRKEKAKQESLTNELLNELATFKRLLETKFHRADENLKLQKNRVEQIKVRFDNGVVTSDEVSKAEQAYNEGRSRAEQLMILLKFCDQGRPKAKPKSDSSARSNLKSGK